MFNHGFPYWIYGAMSFLAAAFVYFYLPETKRRTLEEIQNLWMYGDAHAAAAAKRPAAGWAALTGPA
jgi:MFS transporter, SP family, xylose:H+ symportor